MIVLLRRGLPAALASGAVLAIAVVHPLFGASTSPSLSRNAPSDASSAAESGLAEFDIEWAARAEERKQLVRPAPPRFSPEKAARKIRLTLIARDKKIKVGQTFWYRLEIQNVGREALKFFEDPSFLKNGRYYDLGRYEFWAVQPDGQRHRMQLGNFADELTMGARPPSAHKIPGSENMSDAELRDYMRVATLRARASRRLKVKLEPGETLLSAPWRWVGIPEHFKRVEAGLEVWTPPAGEFRELWTEFHFDKPGRYTITAYYVDKPFPPPDEEFLREMEALGNSRADVIRDHAKYEREKLGRVRSNSIAIEVAQ